MPYFALDIETVPTEAALALPYPEDERLPPGNMKNEDTIAAWRTADRAKWERERVKEFSLNPRYGRVAAVGLAFPGHVLALVAATEADEAKIVDEALSYLTGFNVVLTFNGQGFDLPFLVTRAMLLGLTPYHDMQPYMRRYSYSPHLDLRMALTNWDSYAKGRFADWLEAFKLPSKTGDGAQVWPMVQAKDWAGLADYCANDAWATLMLGARVAPWYGGWHMARELQHPTGDRPVVELKVYEPTPPAEEVQHGA